MNPRIGCASDFLFAYVPYGPLKQLDLFFHSIKCCQEGLEKVHISCYLFPYAAAAIKLTVKLMMHRKSQNP